MDFVGSKRPSQSDQPLTNHEFQSLWSRLAADKRPQTTPDLPSGWIQKTLDVISGIFQGHPATPIPEIRRRIAEGSAKSGLFRTEHWKLELLEVLCWDHYFSSDNAKSIVDTFTYGRDKVRACTTVITSLASSLSIPSHYFKIFGRVVDPENFTKVTAGMRQIEQDTVNDSIGVLSLFHPDNPTGLLSHPATTCPRLTP